ncbi:ribbon-helix-helix domain-containing protein [uncultured Phascolarctobacterium sp.]|uniref:ribbon-helix-helix domain-containing protein n=1 Tax=uncultured Phascolarctobacterium sp. TaxID=512296 RepID=UPI0025EA783B|nr:ribbon-helix-helix domain-containing protein [uncultured Phascolarctobacterium sp.]
MVRQRKEYAAASFKLEKNIYERLCEYSAETGIPKTVVVEKALAMYLENNNEKTSFNNED